MRSLIRQIFVTLAVPTALLMLAFAGCGQDEEPAATAESPAATATATTPTATTPTTPPPDPNTLVSEKVDGSVRLDAVTLDPAWKEAQELRLRLAGGDYFEGGATDMTLQSVYTDQHIYFKVQWTDATESIMSTPMVKQPDGSWHLGPPMPHFEDQMAFMWNINDSIQGFNTSGCVVACHPGEGIPIGGFLGKMYTPGPGQYGDIWEWNAPRTDSFDLHPTINTYVEDWAIDDYSEVIVEVREAGAGRYADPGEDPFIWNVTPGNQFPLAQWNAPPTDSRQRGYIMLDNIAPFVDSDWQVGDWIPVFILRNASGDRADITADLDHSGGKWTMVFGRKLVTESKTDPPVDVQFSDLGKIYFFGVMAIDDGLMHATYPEPLMLRFSR